MKYTIEQETKKYTLTNTKDGLVYITNELCEAKVINKERLYVLIDCLFKE